MNPSFFTDNEITQVLAARINFRIDSTLLLLHGKRGPKSKISLLGMTGMPDDFWPVHRDILNLVDRDYFMTSLLTSLSNEVLQDKAILEL